MQRAQQHQVLTKRRTLLHLSVAPHTRYARPVHTKQQRHRLRSIVFARVALIPSTKMKMIALIVPRALTGRPAVLEKRELFLRQRQIGLVPIAMRGSTNQSVVMLAQRVTTTRSVMLECMPVFREHFR